MCPCHPCRNADGVPASWHIPACCRHLEREPAYGKCLFLSPSLLSSFFFPLSPSHAFQRNSLFFFNALSSSPVTSTLFNNDSQLSPHWAAGSIGVIGPSLFPRIAIWLSRCCTYLDCLNLTDAFLSSYTASSQSWWALNIGKSPDVVIGPVVFSVFIPSHNDSSLMTHSKVCFLWSDSQIQLHTQQPPWDVSQISQTFQNWAHLPQNLPLSQSVQFGKRQSHPANYSHHGLCCLLSLLSASPIHLQSVSRSAYSTFRIYTESEHFPLITATSWSNYLTPRFLSSQQ